MGWMTALTESPGLMLAFGFMACVIATLFYFLLKRDIRNLETKMEHFKDLLKPIKEALSNHVTETRADIKEQSKGISALREGQAEIKGNINLLLKDKDKK